jgi:hypothetical protein
MASIHMKATSAFWYNVYPVPGLLGSEWLWQLITHTGSPGHGGNRKVRLRYVLKGAPFGGV